jgi:ribosomal silencing factor RsfS
MIDAEYKTTCAATCVDNWNMICDMVNTRSATDIVHLQLDVSGVIRNATYLIVDHALMEFLGVYE